MHNPQPASGSGDTIYIEDETLRTGFAQVPNRILRMRGLSHGARLTYALLLSYAWQKGSCFPGQERLAEDLDVSRQSVSTYLRELKEKGLIIVKRRGLGQTNIYILPRLPDTSSENTPDVNPTSHQDVRPALHTEVNAVLHPDVKLGQQADANPAVALDVKQPVQKKDPASKKQRNKPQQTNTVNSDVVSRLGTHGMTEIVAKQLIEKYPLVYLNEKCNYLDFLKAQHSPQIRRNPAGYLRRAIEEDYTAPMGYRDAVIPNAGCDASAISNQQLEFSEAATDIHEEVHPIEVNADIVLSKQLDALLANDNALTGMPYSVYFKGCLVQRQGTRAVILLRHAYATCEARSRYHQRCLHLLRRIDPSITELDFGIV